MGIVLCNAVCPWHVGFLQTESVCGGRGGSKEWGEGHFLPKGTKWRSRTIRTLLHANGPPQMMVSGHRGAEGGRSDIHRSKMEINALFDKRKQTIYVHPEELPASEPFLWLKCGICILMGCYQVINAPVRIYYLRSQLKGSLQNRFHWKIGISSELAFDMLFLALPTRGSHGRRPVRWNSLLNKGIHFGYSCDNKCIHQGRTALSV